MYGSLIHNQVVSANPVIAPSEPPAALIQTFQRIANTPIASTSPVPFTLTYLNSSQVMSRDRENEADRLGLLMAAEAGYHPDFGIVAFERFDQRPESNRSLAHSFQIIRDGQREKNGSKATLPRRSLPSLRTGQLRN